MLLPRGESTDNCRIVGERVPLAQGSRGHESQPQAWSQPGPWSPKALNPAGSPWGRRTPESSQLSKHHIALTGCSFTNICYFFYDIFTSRIMSS